LPTINQTTIIEDATVNIKPVETQPSSEIYIPQDLEYIQKGLEGSAETIDDLIKLGKTYHCLVEQNEDWANATADVWVYYDNTSNLLQYKIVRNLIVSLEDQRTISEVQERVANIIYLDDKYSENGYTTTNNGGIGFNDPIIMVIGAEQYQVLNNITFIDAVDELDKCGIMHYRVHGNGTTIEGLKTKQILDVVPVGLGNTTYCTTEQYNATLFQSILENMLSEDPEDTQTCQTTYELVPYVEPPLPQEEPITEEIISETD
jgi:hypothetical protein